MEQIQKKLKKLDETLKNSKLLNEERQNELKKLQAEQAKKQAVMDELDQNVQKFRKLSIFKQTHEYIDQKAAELDKLTQKRKQKLL